MNSLLQRQVSKYLDEEALEDPKIKAFLTAIDESYNNSEEQFNMLQRAMRISSDELFDANQQLRTDVMYQKDILDSITTAIQALNLKEFEKENGEFEIKDLAEHIREQSEELQIAARKQEQLLKNLENKNQVLTDYAHMVSHDLKSPLRSVDTLISWIKTDNYDSLTAEGKEHFDMILKNVEKMDALIEGILNYSTIEMADHGQYQVDTKYMVQEIVDLLVIPDGIEVEISEKLPVIKADKFRIQQLFENIIHNAVKSIEHEGKIEINVADAGELWKFEIKDSGKGIPERHHHKIFKIFEKIDTNQNSTGIGLSIAKKVVDFYGGQISLESKEDVGTSFYFTLPK
ncbi:phospho-acceptor domain-containing protein [Gramella sp. Hel_I_59]|uniref:sensor histidine kinase n=1 Tax=Gramella sp. Hel_I_59 TaxID=1249978 RepID=UPI00114FC4FB|nr:HAMP domain-containing sensor histidine kinase [Gramella sp. Hel_I_59]TQI71320.1 phospho-acceptor domain-containing protein [Gramella sp. Hel_I_59]